MAGWQAIPNLAQLLAEESVKQYRKLPKQGKPTIQSDRAEWTVLACILAVYADKEKHSVKVVSLGTGLKCLPYSKLCKDGDLVHDAHAEVIARRGINRYILDQADQLLVKDGCTASDSPFCLTDNRRLKLKPHYSFHMYISQSPCGDASMTALAESQSEASFNSFHAGSKRKGAGNPAVHNAIIDNTYANKKRKLSSAANLDESQPIQRGRYGFNQLGVLRTKPGRVDSEPTLSMSCSDKLARWNVLGLQNALCSMILEAPIYLESVVVGDMFDQESLERALYRRLETIKDLPYPYILHQPSIFPTAVAFEASKATLESIGKRADISCGSAILWVIGDTKPEVIVHGRKQGAAKGKPTTSKTRVSICKLALFQKFQSIVHRHSIPHLTFDKEATYAATKQQAREYQEAKACLLNQCFETWVQTPDTMEDFTSSMDLSLSS